MQRCKTLLKRLIAGDNIAIVSDAGTPNICDPGAYIITFMKQYDIPIVPIPGPSSVTTLLSVSGFLANQFYFGGFFPKTVTDYETKVIPLVDLGCLLVFFETAKRLGKTLDRIKIDYPDTMIVIGKELTKPFETIIEGNIKTVIEQLIEIPLKGEFCLILQLQNHQAECDNDQTWLETFKSQQLTVKQAIGMGEKLGIAKNKIKNFYYNVDKVGAKHD
tara:strand:- start:157 stop:810 length:654 start_codon:yes stop_codon:yes gene_type:complete